MMSYTLKSSSEKSLNLLVKFNQRSSSRSYGYRAPTASALGGMNPTLRRFYDKALTNSLVKGTKIKFVDLSTHKYSSFRSFSSTLITKDQNTQQTKFATPIQQFSLLNPEKPSPDYDKPLQPIKGPLTMPRFIPNSNKNNIPSVTKVLQATMPAASAYILEKWKKSMISKLGEAGFAKYQKDTFERGHILHALVANYLLNAKEPIEGEGNMTKEVVSNLWKSIEKVVREQISNVRLIEHTVNHPAMKYRGIVDCVACFNDQLVVIDFKTSEKPKKTTESLYDNPLQVTAYCGAINSDKSIPLHVIDRNICAGLVIVAYIDGSQASTYFFGPEQIDDYWKQWTIRLDQFVKMEEVKR